MTAFETIRVTSEGGVFTIALNRPDALNALTRQMRTELALAIRQSQSNPNCRTIILTGAGDRAFCVGMDMKEPPAQAGAALLESPIDALAECNVPTIAAVNGYAITGGLELALACDLIIASDTASFADTHAKIGALPGWGMSQRLARTIGLARAKEMHFGCKRIDAQTAKDWGLVSYVTPLAGLHGFTTEIARGFADHDPAIVQEIKRIVDQGYELQLTEGLKLEEAAARAWKQSPRSKGDAN